MFGVPYLFDREAMIQEYQVSNVTKANTNLTSDERRSSMKTSPGSLSNIKAIR